MELVYPILCQVITNGELASLKQQNMFIQISLKKNFENPLIEHK